MDKIIITESDLHNIVKDCVNRILKEADRHTPGYWAERWAKQKAERAAAEPTAAKPKKPIKKDRHRPGYYREYNLKHPERLERIGIDPDYIKRVKEFHDCDDLGDEDDIAMSQITLDPSCYDDEELGLYYDY